MYNVRKFITHDLKAVMYGQKTRYNLYYRNLARLITDQEVCGAWIGTGMEEMCMAIG